MEKQKKQVIMTYDEHQQWITERALYQQDLDKIGDKLTEQEKVMEELIKERDDIVVIERHRMMVQRDYKLRLERGIGYHSYEDRYVNFPRFIGGDELAKALDEGFMEMHGEIRNLQAQLNDSKAGRDKDKKDFFTSNLTIPIPDYNKLSKRDKRILRKLVLKARNK